MIGKGIHCTRQVNPRRRRCEEAAGKGSNASYKKDAKPATPKQLNGIWVSLGAKDRGIRHAARVALEKQPVKNWKKKLSPEKKPVVASAAMIALARVRRPRVPRTFSPRP